jgi:phospholipid transport system substrate-binding protein
MPTAVFAASSAESYVAKVGNGVIAAARNNSVSQFRSLLKANADIPTIAIYSLGSYRKSLTADVKAEYFSLVENYIAKVFQQYAKKLAGQGLEVQSTSNVKDDSVLVKSVLNFEGGRSVPVTWRLVKRGGGYRIFDVNVDGIWLASTQKTNFVSVLKRNNGKMSALLEYLRQSTTARIEQVPACAEPVISGRNLRPRGLESSLTDRR